MLPATSAAVASPATATTSAVALNPGLGDVHRMGAAGTIIGPVMVVVAFFIAPFFGLAWAASQMFFKKIRQIPYGPFLSLGVFVVMILHKWIVTFLSTMFYR